MAIAQEIYKLDPLSFISDTYSKFQAVVATLHGGSEMFCGFESRFDAALSKYYAVFHDAKLPPALLAFLLLSSAHFDSSQRASILASVSSNLGMAGQASGTNPLTYFTLTDDSNNASPSTVANQLEYDAVASVLQSFDDGCRKSAFNNTVSFNGVNYHIRKCNYKSTRKKVCWDCGDESHFRSDARCPKRKEPSSKTGSNDYNSTSNKKSFTDDNTSSKSNKTCTVIFNMAKFSE